MSSDIVMIGLVLAGIALSITYFYVAALLWRHHARREREQDEAQRKLHGERVRASVTSKPGPAISPTSDRQIAA